MSVPLFAHASPNAVLAYRGRQPILAAQFLADVDQLAKRLPKRGHMLNACADRYHFAVGFAASLQQKITSLLPSTHTSEVIGHVRAFAPDVFCLTDDPDCEIELPRLAFPAHPAELRTIPALSDWRVPEIAFEQCAAYVFTSGSTGLPLPHRKTWGRLHQCVRIEAQRLGLSTHRAWTLLATVPTQHMYGLETSLLLALANGHAFCAERPFYPADIAAQLSALPRPRLLVTTPVHLRALLNSGVALPPVDLVVAATAPLDPKVAAQAELLFDAPLLEIYGATETGQIALRRTTHSLSWTLWPEVELSIRDGVSWAQGGHIEQPTALADILELSEPGCFLLHGRSVDLINVGGKRSSLAYLNYQLTAIPGVVDGAFFLREDCGDATAAGVDRLGAVVVAPSLSADTIREHLRRTLDPVFLPRPLLIVESIPRNATGKLPLAALQSLVQRYRS